ncbi:TRAP transporter fused permease subunit [Geminicoccaceae bacterium 1502E]|nr:TRAP transporter fused permease subunit [Geminicoccaceae bacterium 1502E]
MRDLKGKAGLAIAIWAAAATLFQLYTAWIGYLEPRSQRSLHLLLFLPLAFFLFPARPGRSPQSRPSLPDLTLGLLAVVPSLYSWLEADRINLRLEGLDELTTAELWLGGLITALMIEALRRAVSPMLAGLATVILVYLFTTEYWPGVWGYRDLPTWEIIEIMYLRNGMGVYGTLTGISTTMVAIFIAFGAFVEGIGLGSFFNNVGSRLAGRQTGGPGKVAVITSAFFGTMSGSSSANVFATGSFTIPMMKRLGYRPAFAGGVEAAASVGGQLMPPIMGAGAFVMAEITNIPYLEIVKAASLGALCYFFMLLVTVHLEAKRLGLAGLPEEQIPTWRSVLRDLHLLLPVVVLLGLLIMRFSPHFAALWSIIASLGVSMLRRHTRLSLEDLFWVLVRAGCNITIVAMACVGAGMIVAGLTVTGLVLSFGSMIASASGGVLLIAGVLLMFTTLLLGMGLPTSAAYIITSSIGAATLTGEFGVPLLAAHLFVFYFAILADATPPVSIASYAAASIAKAPPMMTGLQALRMAIAGFLIGFSFLYTPALLLDAPWLEIVLQLAVNLLALTVLAAGLAGYFQSRIVLPFRLLLIVAGPALALSENIDELPRIALAAAILLALHFLPHVFSLGAGRPAPAGADK